MKFRSTKLKKYQIAGVANQNELFPNPWEAGLDMPVTSGTTPPVELTVYDPQINNQPPSPYQSQLGDPFGVQAPVSGSSAFDQMYGNFGNDMSSAGEANREFSPTNYAKEYRQEKREERRNARSGFTPTAEYSGEEFPPEISSYNKEQYLAFMKGKGVDEAEAAAQWERYQASQKQKQTAFPYINPYGSSLSSRAYLSGKGFATGTPLGTAMGITSGLSAGIGLAGDFMAGFATQRRNQYVKEEERRRMRQGMTPRYEAASASGATNTTSGQSFKYGGLFSFQDGGEMMMAGAPDPNEQVFGMINQMLGEGQTPENIIQILIQQGVQPEQAEAMVAAVLQQMQQGQSFQTGGPMIEPPTFPVMSNMQRPDDPVYRRLKQEQDRLMLVRDRGSNIPREVDYNTYMNTDRAARMPIMSRKNMYLDLAQQPNTTAFKDASGQTVWVDRNAKGFYTLDENKMRREFQPSTISPFFQDGGEQAAMEQQVMQAVAQMLSQGAAPEEVIQMLVEQGVPQEQAMQIVQMVMQQMQQPAMQYGGLFGNVATDPIQEQEDFYGKGVGDYVEFEYGGKLQKGIIKSIKGGKITLG
jgi:transcriptional regulator CtsR